MSTYFDRAVMDAKAYRRRLFKGKDPSLAPSVEVTHRIGTTTFARCFLDSFEPGYITITPVDPDSATPPTTYGPGQWREANQRSADGLIEVSLIAQEDSAPSMLRQVAG